MYVESHTDDRDFFLSYIKFKCLSQNKAKKPQNHFFCCHPSAVLVSCSERRLRTSVHTFSCMHCGGLMPLGMFHAWSVRMTEVWVSAGAQSREDVSCLVLCCAVLRTAAVLNTTVSFSWFFFFFLCKTDVSISVFSLLCLYLSTSATNCCCFALPALY